MSLQAVTLARRKAALTRHYGPDDPRVRKVAVQLRAARARELAEGLTSDELDELLTALTGA